MNDAAYSYRCKVSEGNTQAKLHIGMRRYQVAVVGTSRDRFTVRVPSSFARKLSVGCKYKLLYQEMLYRVSCTDKWIAEFNQVELEFLQLEELTPPKLESAPFSGKVKGVAAAGQADPTLPFALLVAFIIAVLITPAWGGKWGTSDMICNGVLGTWNALVELVAGSK